MEPDGRGRAEEAVGEIAPGRRKSTAASQPARGSGIVTIARRHVLGKPCHRVPVADDDNMALKRRPFLIPRSEKRASLRAFS